MHNMDHVCPHAPPYTNTISFLKVKKEARNPLINKTKSVKFGAGEMTYWSKVLAALPGLGFDSLHPHLTTI